MEDIWFWVIFNAVIVVLLLGDLFLFHRKSHEIKVKEALWMSAFWIGLAFLFNIFIYQTRGIDPALNFLTGYLVEKALSVDNLFVFLLIFTYFKVPKDYTHKVLFWGILGAIVMRAAFILAGIALVEQFHWILYIFGAFLIYTGIKLGLEKDKEINPEDNPIVKFARRFFPVTKDYDADNFFVVKAGKFFATPLFIVLVAIETTDVIFALDSIPAVIGITTDPFIVYTSNILAILGLRSLYFALSHLMTLFHYLHYGLAFILVFIGVKMLIAGFIDIPIFVSLSVILFALLMTILASIYSPKKDKSNHDGVKK